jgi:hypothetical protein
LFWQIMASDESTEFRLHKEREPELHQLRQLRCCVNCKS